MTINQGNALRKLDKILSKVLTEKQDQGAGPVLLKEMGLKQTPNNLALFFRLMAKAKEEAMSIKKENINRYLAAIDDLYNLFFTNSVWDAKLSAFVSPINSRNLLLATDALAEYYHNQNPIFSLEQDFLDYTQKELNSLLEKVIKSDISKDLKSFIESSIGAILKAVRNYQIDGTEELDKIIKSLITELMMKEKSINDKDKNNPAYKKFQAILLSFTLWTAPSPYDIIGAVPDLNEFWIPGIQKMAEDYQKIEEIVIETETIQEAIEKTRNIFDKQSIKRLSGKEIKALPAGQDDFNTADSAHDE